MSLLENIHRIIHESMKNNKIPGVALAVIKDNQIILSQGYGTTHIEDWSVPVTNNTLFRIASVSKLFTGTLMMRLVEKGLIDLDKPIQHYVHWFTASDKELSKLITLRMLMSHSSGLPTGGALSPFYRENGLYEYMKEVVPTLPIQFHPGTAYSYGNHALNIAGFVAQHVTGTPFATLMQEMVFEPLGMTQTTYHPSKAMTYPLALPHDKSSDGDLVISHQFFDNSASYPSYYAFSSIEDLSKFALMHLREGSSILTSSSVQEMRKLQSKWYNLTNAGCGITFFRETKDGIERFWHYGQYSTQYSSQFILVPEKGIAVIALANGENIFQAGYEIIDELLKNENLDGAMSSMVDITVEPDWKYYEGTYLHSYFGLFEIKEGLIKHNDQVYKLVRHRHDTYLVKDDKGNNIFTVGFPSPHVGQTIKSIMVNSNACPEFKTEDNLDPSKWKNWEGLYSDGRDEYEVRFQEMSLILSSSKKKNEIVGPPLTNNLFLTQKYGVVGFGEINGVVTLEFDFAWRFTKK